MGLQLENKEYIQSNQEYRIKIKELQSDIDRSQNQLHAELQYHQTSLPYLSQMQTSLKHCDDETHELQEQNIELNKTIKTLRAKNYRIKQENERFQVILEKNNEQNDRLKQKNNALIAENAQYEKEINQLQDELSAINEELQTNSLKSVVSNKSNQSLMSMSPMPRFHDMNAIETLHFKQSTTIQFNSLQSLLSGGSMNSIQLQFASSNMSSEEVQSPNDSGCLSMVGDIDYIARCEQLEKELDAMKNRRNEEKCEEDDDDEGVDELIKDVTWSKLLDDSISDVLKEHDSNIIAKCQLLQYETQLRRHRVKESFKGYKPLQTNESNI